MRHPTLLIALMGCNKGAPVVAEAPEPAQPALVSIEVEPFDSVLETRPGAPGTLQLTATGTREDGTTLPLDLVEWTVSNPSAGTIDDTGLFEANTTNGGITWVVARLDGVEGQATITVRWVDEVLDPAIDPSLFDGAVIEVAGGWAYPEDGVNVPRNTPSLHLQWHDRAAYAYRVTLRSDLTELSMYTLGTDMLLDDITWTTVASTNAGGVVELLLDAAVGGEVLREIRTVEVNRMDADGSVIYWSTSRAGFVEIPYGGVAADLLTQDQTGRCMGCHALSPDNKIAFTWDGGNGNLGLQRLSDGGVLIGDAEPYRGNFKTFSPDGRFLMATDTGNLQLFDANTGELLSMVRELGDATHVDWAPDDSAVAITLSEGHTIDWVLETPSRIALLPHLGDGQFGEAVVIHSPEAPWRSYYPSWSPDSEWIVFNQSTEDTYDDPDAELWLVDRDGERPAVRLDSANNVGALTNSWPRWAPLPDDDVLWIAFASKRAYGTQTPEGLPQIWIAAIDPMLAAAGIDPSWPALWLPGQDPVTGNHIPVWVP